RCLAAEGRYRLIRWPAHQGAHRNRPNVWPPPLRRPPLCPRNLLRRRALPDRVPTSCSCRRNAAKRKRKPHSARCKPSSRINSADVDRSFGAPTWVIRGFIIGQWLVHSRAPRKRADFAAATNPREDSASFRGIERERLTLLANAG